MKKTIRQILVIWGTFVTTTQIIAQTNTLPATGNVGIGTATPATKLEVMGTAHIDQALKVYDSMTVTGNSRVGPDFKVDGNSRTEGNAIVLGELKLPNIQVPSTLNNTELLFVNANSEVIKGGYDLLREKLYKGPINCEFNGKSLDLANPFWYNGLNKLFNPCPQVQVGIGTDTPTHGLTVVTDAFVGQGLTVVGTTYSNKLALGIDAVSAVGVFHMKVPTTTTANDAPLFIIENASRKLVQINNKGLLRARQIKVNLDAAWADYVFENNYPLMTLSAVETFITKNKHLPNVPSASQIEEEGIDISDMNRILMEKVEELTLYVIAQNKELKCLNKRISAFESTKK